MRMTRRSLGSLSLCLHSGRKSISSRHDGWREVFQRFLARAAAAASPKATWLLRLSRCHRCALIRLDKAFHSDQVQWVTLLRIRFSILAHSDHM